MGDGTTGKMSAESGSGVESGSDPGVKGFLENGDGERGKSDPSAGEGDSSVWLSCESDIERPRVPCMRNSFISILCSLPKGRTVAQDTHAEDAARVRLAQTAAPTDREWRGGFLSGRASAINDRAPKRVAACSAERAHGRTARPALAPSRHRATRWRGRLIVIEVHGAACGRQCLLWIDADGQSRGWAKKTH